MPVFETIVPPGGNPPFPGWSCPQKFGRRLTSGRRSAWADLQTNDPPARNCIAVFDGLLTTRIPTGFLDPPGKPPASPTAGSAPITVYLVPGTVKTSGEWLALGKAVAGQFTSSVDPTLHQDCISYIAYRNLDAASVKLALGVTNAAQWNAFVAGRWKLAASVGQSIGNAAGSLPAQPANAPFQVSVAIGTRFGMLDPAAFYAAMATAPLVTAPPSAGTLATLLGNGAPLIGDQAVDAVGQADIWPWCALMEYQHRKALTYRQWRRLGDLQKSKYRDQLLALVRPSSAPAGATPFAFDGDDLLNVFQIEAVAEFFVNCPEPWSTAPPVQPGAVAVAGAAAYRTANLLALYGTTANAVAGSPTTVNLPDDIDFDRISAGRDTILFAGAPHKFRIMAVDAATKTVTLDVAPAALGAWRMFHNPTLVHVDPFGSRVHGDRAVAGAGSTLTLQSLTAAQERDLKKVNAFDTIQLGAVSTGPRAGRLVSPLQIDTAAHTAVMSLDRALTPAGGASTWAIPAGLGTPQWTIDRPDTAANQTLGWDHYDSMMFVVAGGEVRTALPFSSFTSRKMQGDKTRASNLSSIKGNRFCYFDSYLSGKSFINAGFRVVDEGGRISGNREVPSVAGSGRRLQLDRTLTALVKPGQEIGFITALPPRFTTGTLSAVDTATNTVLLEKPGAVPANPAPYWIAVYDGLHEGRYYFNAAFEPDNAEPAKIPGAAGKGQIRIHRGVMPKSGSEGCQVSPYFARLRAALISAHLETNETYYADYASNTRVDRIGHMHTDLEHPKLIVEYADAIDDLTALNKRITNALADPVIRAIDDAMADGFTDQNLDHLRLAAERLRERIANQDIDPIAEEETLPMIEALTEQAADPNTAAMLEWLTAQREPVMRWRQRAQEISERIEQIRSEIGWKNAIAGEYWLIRPDEREKPL